MASLIQAAPFFLLLSLPMVSFSLSITRLHIFLPIEKKDSARGSLPGIYIAFPLVLYLGLVSALSGTFGLIGLNMEENHGFLLGQKILELVIRIALALCLLYLLNPQIILHLTSHVSLNSRSIRVHNHFFSVLIACSGIISLISLFTPIPIYLPQIFVALTCCFPIPLIILVARRQTVFHLRGWLVLLSVQFSGLLSACFASMPSHAFFLVHTVFFILSISGMMALFQMLCSPVTFESLQSATQCGSPTEEDFRSLQDPFMASPRSPGAMSVSGITSTAWSDSPRPSYTHSLASSPELSLKKNTPQRHNATATERGDSTQDEEIGLESKRRSRRTLSEPLLPAMVQVPGESKVRAKRVSIQSTSSVATILASESSIRGQGNSQARIVPCSTIGPGHARRPSTPTVWYLEQPDVGSSVQYALRQEYLREGYRAPSQQGVAPRNTTRSEEFPMYSPV
ncbi:hypothetical protein M422DRAFT_66126 [Sphaerobolus stellatus SS14]|nr:hypothetical protein M422DRAFT_66126 [Sphaerobolus stellatus SS14]